MVPSHPVAYACLLGSTLDVISRACGVLAETYSDILSVKALVSKEPETTVEFNGLENVDFFNFFLKDFSCMLYVLLRACGACANTDSLARCTSQIPTVCTPPRSIGRVYSL